MGRNYEEVHRDTDQLSDKLDIKLFNSRKSVK